MSTTAKVDLGGGERGTGTNRSSRFSLTMPSDAAKKARTCEMKNFSSSLSFVSQWLRSLERS